MKETNTLKPKPDYAKILLHKSQLDKLVKSMDPSAELEPAVKDFLLDYVDEFVEKVVDKSAALARLRGANQISPKDVQFVLDRIYKES